MPRDEELVKGMLLLSAGVARKIRDLREAGRIDALKLERELSPRALDLLDEEISMSRWYPIRAFCELLDLDWEICGDRKPAYMEDVGARSVDAMFDSGLYQQLEFVERSGRAGNRQNLRGQAKLISSIAGSVYSFLKCDVDLSSQRLEINFRNASAFGDALLHSTVGFMNQINARQGSTRRFRGERVRNDHIRFVLDLPERLVESDW